MATTTKLAPVESDDTDIMPWERQPRESGPAWEAFVLYRDLGPRRSLSQVAELLVLQSIGSGKGDVGSVSGELRVEPARRKRHSVPTVSSALSQLKVWSRTRNWRDRCEAYDREQDRLRQEALHEQLRQHQRAMAHPASVLLAALAAEPTLTEQLANLVIAGVKGEKGEKAHLPAIWRELMQVIQQGATGASQLVTAERAVRAVRASTGGALGDERGGNSDGSGDYFAELPASEAVLAGINALGLGAAGYVLVAGRLRFSGDQGRVDAGAAPGTAE